MFTFTISPRTSITYLTDPVLRGQQPPGRWHGRGAEHLGLTGEVDHDQLHAVFRKFLDPRDPRFTDPTTRDQARRLPGSPPPNTLGTAEERLAAALEQEPDAMPERREKLRMETERSTSRVAAFYDVTVPAREKLTELYHTSVLGESIDRQDEAGAWEERRRKIEDLVWVDNQATLNHIFHYAGYARVGHHGPAGGRYIDAHDWVVASFLHTPHDDNPQVHIHNAVLSQAECSDGKWRTLYVHDIRSRA